MTGIVGLAGIAATSWQAERAHKAGARNLAATLHADANRAKLAEKRGIYNQYLAAVGEAMLAMADAQVHPNSQETDAAYAAAMIAATAALHELMLIASGEVAQLANAVSQNLGRADNDPRVIMRQTAVFTAQLSLIMRADLGEEQLSGSETSRRISGCDKCEQ